MRLIADSRAGERIRFVEQFELGEGVTHPLLSLGRLLTDGWTVSQDVDVMYLHHSERDHKLPCRLARNNFVMDVRVCAVQDVSSIFSDKEDESSVEVDDDVKISMEEAGEQNAIDLRTPEGEVEELQGPHSLRVLQGYLSGELAASTA